MRHFVFALAACSLAVPAFAQTAPQYRPEDVVRAEPVTLASAADVRPDIARFLLVRSARGAVPLEGTPSRVAYLSDVTGTPQVWTVPAAGGMPDQMTYGSGVDWVEPAPGGGLLYGADTDGDERVGMFWLSMDGTRERAVVAKSAAFRRFGDWSGDGKRFAYASTERNGRDFDVWEANLATGATRSVLRNDGVTTYPVAWQPNGELVLLSEPRGESANNVHLLNMATGERVTLLKPRRAAVHGGLRWRRDGKGFFLAHNEATDHMVVAYYDLATRRVTTIADTGRDVGEVRPTDDGRYLLWTTVETGFDRLHVRDLASGRDLAVPALPAGTLSMRTVRGSSRMLFTTNSPVSAGEVWEWDPATAVAPRLVISADTPGLDLSSMVMPEAVAFPARDGAPLTGLFYRPRLAPGAPPPPVFLAVHGGPSSHARPVFRPELQYYLSRGIAVLDFNYRGSTGQGRAFTDLNDRWNKVNEVVDLADAVVWLRRSGRVDGTRVAVGGGSYGGYLTNQALGTYPDLFVAGVSSVGVSDWVAALEGASPELKASDRLEFGDISDPKVRAFFAKLSPINNVAKIRTPLMVLHGANDPRDPVTESDRLVAGVRANGAAVTYLRFPDEGHGISKVANQVHAQRRIAAFLEKSFAEAAER